jgi:hypothetical protein
VINGLVETQYSVERVAEVKRRFLGLSDCISIEAFFSGWFHGVPFESVRRGNVEDFVAYGFYCRTMQGLPPQVRGCRCNLWLDNWSSIKKILLHWDNREFCGVWLLLQTMQGLPPPLIGSARALGAVRCPSFE